MSDKHRLQAEGIREDGTVEGCFIETHYSPLEYIRFTPGADGYVKIVSDWMDVHIETRVAATDIVRLAAKLVEATPELSEPTP